MARELYMLYLMVVFLYVASVISLHFNPLFSHLAAYSLVTIISFLTRGRRKIWVSNLITLLVLVQKEGSSSVTVHVSKEDKILFLKEQISSKTGLSGDYNFVYGGRILKDDQTIEFYDIRHGSIINVNMLMRGGGRGEDSESDPKVNVTVKPGEKRTVENKEASGRKNRKKRKKERSKNYHVKINFFFHIWSLIMNLKGKPDAEFCSRVHPYNRNR